MSSSNCCFLTCIPVSQEAGKVAWYSHLLKNFPQFVAIHTVTSLGFPDSSNGKESACNGGDLGLIPGLGRSPGEGHGNALQYSHLENSMGRGAWRAPIYGVTKSQTQPSDHYFHFYFLSYSQRLYCSQWSRSRYFLKFPCFLVWSNGYWQFDLWFLCLS